MSESYLIKLAALEKQRLEIVKAQRIQTQRIAMAKESEAAFSKMRMRRLESEREAAKEALKAAKERHLKIIERAQEDPVPVSAVFSETERRLHAEKERYLRYRRAAHGATRARENLHDKRSGLMRTGPSTQTQRSG